MPETTIARLAASRGRRVWLVGGAVRDALLGRCGGDVDLALDGATREIGHAAARALGGSFRWNARFMTGRLELPQARIDLARTRCETYAAPAALPRIRPADLEQDLARRDFSVNAMAVELLPDARGRLVDPFDGRRDVAARLLRALHPASFTDDPTRAFRALRFSVRLGFRLEPATRRCLRQAIRREMPQRLSGERVAAELRLALAEERPAAVLCAFLDAGLGSLWGGVPAAAALRHARGRLARLGVPSRECTALFWGCAFANLQRFQREALVHTLRLRRVEKAALIDGPARGRELLGRIDASRGRADLDRICAATPPNEVLLAALLAPAGTYARIARWWSGARDLALLIDGNDLRDAGLAAGPGIAVALAAARAALLAGRAPDRASQLRAALGARHRT